MTSHALRLALLMVLLAGLVGCQSYEQVRLTVTNEMKFAIEVEIEPQFHTNRPRHENLRAVDLEPGAMREVHVERGLWMIKVDSDEMELPKTRRIDFQTGGKIVVDHWIIRYMPDKPVAKSPAQPGS